MPRKSLVVFGKLGTICRGPMVGWTWCVERCGLPGVAAVEDVASRAEDSTDSQSRDFYEIDYFTGIDASDLKLGR